MTDATAGVTPAEPVPPVPSAPEAIAELEAAPPQAPEAVASAEAPAERALPFDVEHLGVLRRAVLDHLVDTDEPQSVAQILAAMPPGTTRGSAESAIKREFDAGRIERVGPGLYVLAKAKPPGQPQPAPPPEPEPVRSDGMTGQEWLAALEAWLVDGHRIPTDIATRFEDRLRKREERRRDAEAAATRQAAADAELLAKLKDATGGNFTPGPGIEDVSPIRMALQLVPIDSILTSIRFKTDKKLYPGNEPATTWRAERLLKGVATTSVPQIAADWLYRANRQSRTTARNRCAIVRPGAPDWTPLAMTAAYDDRGRARLKDAREGPDSAPEPQGPS
jgi:hypothetical protein